jgi:hypothetical protein
MRIEGSAVSSSGGVLTCVEISGSCLFVALLTDLFTRLLRYVALPVGTFQMRRGVLTLSLVQ